MPARSHSPCRSGERSVFAFRLFLQTTKRFRRDHSASSCLQLPAYSHPATNQDPNNMVQIFPPAYALARLLVALIAPQISRQANHEEMRWRSRRETRPDSNLEQGHWSGGGVGRGQSV